MKYMLLIAAFCFLWSCDTEGSKDVSPDPIDEGPVIMDELITLMTGSFTSAQQASNDSNYFDISLQMVPIWENNPDGRWLYVEQAVSSNLRSPYRQRVYHVTQLNDSTFSSAVMELNTPELYVHGWESDSLFHQLTLDSIAAREGCAVILTYHDGKFSGSTDEDACKSDFRGAAYATSIVHIDSTGIVSWDQGWSAEGEQVWGAENGGYIFLRNGN